MSTLDQMLNTQEKQKLESMYSGDKSRDASDKIRGFLFQDLVAIDYLLDKETEYVCLEFLEDVDVFYSDGTLKVIQVKYYPNSIPDMREIMTDLYYQYLRMEEFNLNMTVKPLLLIHREENVTPLNLDKMLEYTNCSKLEKPDIIEKPDDWFEKEIYTSKKKKEQKKKLFEKRAYVDSISCFLGDFGIIMKKNINYFKEDIAEKLRKEFSQSDIVDNEENIKKILLGLALGYIQRRYTLVDPKFEQVRVSKEEFKQYIFDIVDKQSEEHIAAYVRTIVGEQYIKTIEENPKMDSQKINMLNQIAENTQIWMSELAETKDGQYQIINTVCNRNKNYLEGYTELGFADRKTKIAECRNDIESFLKYLWKIMLDLCMNKAEFDLEKDKDMLRPQTYINESVTNYICIKFKEDFVDTSIILPGVKKGERVSTRRNICTRMYLEKPQKWFMSGEDCGKKEYRYSTANISDGNSVLDIESDIYYIECMDCIKIDADQWNEVDDCEKSIFAKECINGKEF